MDKLKTIGISALAGTLVSLSAAQAGGVSVSGSWELSYTSKDSSEVTGNRLGMNKNITFGGSGDVTSGGGITWGTTVAMNDAMSGLSSASMAINVGGIATLAYDSGTGGYGANAVDNIVPTAWEEADAGFATGMIDVGTVSKQKGVINLTIKAPVAGTAISLSYASQTGGDHVADGGSSGASTHGERAADLTLDLVNYSASQFGFRLGAAAEMIFLGETCKQLKNDVGIGNMDALASCGHGGTPYWDHPYAGTVYSSLRIGPLSYGAQLTYKDPQDMSASGVQYYNSYVYGGALTIGKYASFSYQKGDDRYNYNDATRNSGFTPRDPTSDGGNAASVARVGGAGAAGFKNTSGDESVHTEFQGWSAAINAGPVALKYFRNNVENINGGGTSDDHNEINLSIAF